MSKEEILFPWIPIKNSFGDEYKKGFQLAKLESDLSVVQLIRKTNTNAKILIYGYASPEGSADFNQKLSQQRADKVKQMLVEHYQISADRITAEGKGIGEIFPQPTWNRLSVCVINIVQ